MPDESIQAMAPEDWGAVRAIYEAGIATGHATFETAIPDWEAWDAGHLDDARLVVRRGGDVVGWAALTPVSRREVYAGVAEVSLYVAPEARGSGVGGRLMAALVTESEAAGIWTLQAAIFPENQESIALHLKHGFREVGQRERIGRHHGAWRDTVLLERRSPTVATD